MGQTIWSIHPPSALSHLFKDLLLLCVGKLRILPPIFKLKSIINSVNYNHSICATEYLCLFLSNYILIPDSLPSSTSGVFYHFWPLVGHFVLCTSPFLHTGPVVAF